jgi:serine/threonine protein phosphatase PrpC
MELQSIVRNRKGIDVRYDEDGRRTTNTAVTIVGGVSSFDVKEGQDDFSSNLILERSNSAGRRTRYSSLRSIIKHHILRLFFAISITCTFIIFINTRGITLHLRSPMPRDASDQPYISPFPKKHIISSYKELLASDGNDETYGRLPPSGQFLWDCDDGGSGNRIKMTSQYNHEDKNLCHIQFPILDISDYIDEPHDKYSKGSPSTKKLDFPTYAKTYSNDWLVLTRRGNTGVRDKFNQDRAFVIHPQGISSETFVMGIFDGHGDFGHAVTESMLMTTIRYFFKMRQRHQLGKREVQANYAPEQIGSKVPEHEPSSKGWALHLFQKMHERLNPQFSEKSGSTASIIVKRSDEVFIANTGDSNSFIIAYEKQANVDPLESVEPRKPMIKVVYKSRRDKPHLRGERERIENAGGNIEPPFLLFGETYSSRVSYTTSKGELYSLAMSRSIGDAYSKHFGVIVDPIVDHFYIQDLKRSFHAGDQDHSLPLRHENAPRRESIENDNIELIFVSLSDGLFDQVNIDDIAHQLVISFKSNTRGALYESCKHLLLKSSQMWAEKSLGRSMPLYRDDISIAVYKI